MVCIVCFCVFFLGSVNGGRSHLWTGISPTNLMLSKLMGACRVHLEYLQEGEGGDGRFVTVHGRHNYNMAMVRKPGIDIGMV